MSVYYITKDSILNFEKNRKIFVKGIENKILTQEEIIKQGKEELYKDCVTYTGDNPFIGYPIIEGEIVRAATRLELINMGKQTLRPGEYIENNEIKTISKPNNFATWNKEKNIWETLSLPDGYILKEDNSVEYIAPEIGKYVIAKWNKDTNMWEEGASQEEIKKAYCDLIIEYQNQVMEAGFIWTHQHSDGSNKTHIQRVRQGIDIPILETAISSLADARAIAEKQSEIPQIDSYPWSFDDLGEDICELTETELRELRLVGNGVFGVAVYKTSGILKQKEPSLSITLNDFLTELKKHTSISALLNKGDEIN